MVRRGVRPSRRCRLAAPAARVNWLVGAARLAIDQAAFAEAAAYCEQAAAVARERGDAADLAAALNTRGMLARGQDQYAESGQAHEAALPLARAAGDRSGAAAALLGLAYVAMFTGDASGRPPWPSRAWPHARASAIRSSWPRCCSS